MTLKKIKIMIIGDSGVGKTSFLKKFADGIIFRKFVEDSPDFILRKCNALKEYIKTPIDRSITLNTTEGLFTLEFREYNSIDKNFIPHVAFLFFDIMNLETYDSVPSWYESLKELYPSITIIMCGNKVDESKLHEPYLDAMLKQDELRKDGLLYHYISVKSEFNIYSPILEAIRLFTGNDTITFEEYEVTDPTTIPLLNTGTSFLGKDICLNFDL